MSGKKIPLLLAGVAMFASVVCAYLARPPVQGGLVATKPVLDLGELSQGQTVAAEFELVNRSSGPVKILDVVKTCTCTQVEISRYLLEPQEGMVLATRWKTGASRGKTGANIGVVYTQADGPAQFLNLGLEANVVPDILFEPAEVIFEGNHKGSRVVTFSPGRRPDVSLVRAACTQPAFNAKILPGGSRVEVSFNPSLWPAEEPSVDLEVETTSPNERVCRVAVRIVRARKSLP